ncbi:hypothetical protein HHI36_012388 [Cryptolaemus montrouzieri]|uniref:Uncharacterized protein n=1 Tax=Cryptolaemus montrouzieri TaxID=559131 RepID=A0ABD2NE38_9CUCU
MIEKPPIPTSVVILGALRRERRVSDSRNEIGNIFALCSVLGCLCSGNLAIELCKNQRTTPRLKSKRKTKQNPTPNI